MQKTKIDQTPELSKSASLENEIMNLSHELRTLRAEQTEKSKQLDIAKQNRASLRSRLPGLLADGKTVEAKKAKEDCFETDCLVEGLEAALVVIAARLEAIPDAIKNAEKEIAAIKMPELLEKHSRLVVETGKILSEIFITGQAAHVGFLHSLPKNLFIIKDGRSVVAWERGRGLV